MRCCWKATPEIRAFCFFGGRKLRDERGRGKRDAFSKAQQKKVREVQKLRRAVAPLNG
jgi:hypothetical protein